MDVCKQGDNNIFKDVICVHILEVWEGDVLIEKKGLKNIIHILVEEVWKGVLLTTEKLMLFLKKNLE